MKKLIALLLVLAMALTLVACGAKSAPAAAPGSPTQIEFWTFQDLHVSFYEKMAAKWNEANPDQQIELVTTVYPYDDMHNKLLIALQSGVGAPDMVDIEIGKYANFLMGDVQLLPLNDVIEPELDNIVSARVEIYSKDDQYYGIDFHIGAAVAFYNTEMCEAAGIDWQNIKTWDEYYAAGQKLKAAMPDKYWVSLETGDVWHFWPLLGSQGGDLVTADGTPNIDSPEVIKALEYNRKMVDEGLAMLAPGGTHHTEEFYGLMNTGAAASVIMPLWYMDRFTDYMPDLSGKMATAVLPVWEVGQPRSIGQGGTGTSITNQADNPEVAKAFLAFAKLSEAGGAEIWNTLGQDPIVKSVWNNEAVTRAENKFTAYYVNNPFDVLNEIKDEILPHNVNSALPATMDAMRNNVFNRAYSDANVDIAAMVAEEQSKIMY